MFSALIAQFVNKPIYFQLATSLTIAFVILGLHRAKITSRYNIDRDLAKRAEEKLLSLSSNKDSTLNHIQTLTREMQGINPSNEPSESKKALMNIGNQVTQIAEDTINMAKKWGGGALMLLGIADSSRGIASVGNRLFESGELSLKRMTTRRDELANQISLHEQSLAQIENEMDIEGKRLSDLTLAIQNNLIILDHWKNGYWFIWLALLGAMLPFLLHYIRNFVI